MAEQLNYEKVLNRMIQRWANKNPEMIKDIQEISDKIVLFNMKWGMNAKVNDFMSPEEPL